MSKNYDDIRAMLWLGLRYGLFWSLLTFPLILVIFPAVTNYLSSAIEFDRRILFIFWVSSLNIVMLAIVIPALYQLKAENKVMFISCAALIINIIGNFLLIPEIGSLGAAVSTLLGGLVSVLGICWLCLRHNLIKPSFS